MTPTEQDNELREAICDAMHVYPEELKYRLPNSFGNSELEAIMQLITADRKRVALEARLNEVQNAYEHWINGRSFISSYFRDRIALLSNTKESK